MILKYFLKSIIRNRSLWGWGVLFMVFWLALGAFLFSSDLPNDKTAILYYTSSYYGIVALFSFSSLAITISYTVYYGSSSLAYSFRYTRLTPMSYFSSLLAASSVMEALIGLIMLAATYSLFSWKFGVNLTPFNPVACLAISALSGAFMMVLGMSLVLSVVNYFGVRNISFVGFIPLLLSYLFGFGQLYASIPDWVEYASPFTSISSLIFSAYSGKPPPVQFTNPTLGSLDWHLLIISLVAWIAFLFLLDIGLLRNIKPRHIEEARQV